MNGDEHSLMTKQVSMCSGTIGSSVVKIHFSDGSAIEMTLEQIAKEHQVGRISEQNALSLDELLLRE